MPAISQLSINLATVREQWGLRQAVEGCARHGIPAVAPWRDQVARIGLKESARAIADSGLRVSGLCRGGMFPAPTAEGRRRADEDNLRALEEAVTLQADCLVLVVGGLPEGSKDLRGARGMVAEGIARLLEAARPAGMPLAIEPLHPMYAADRACVNTLAQALDLCDRLGEGVGVALETGQETPESLLELLGEPGLEGVGVNFDPANMLLYGSGDPIRALEALAQHIVQVHLKDAVGPDRPGVWGTETPAGRGAVDWEAFFSRLNDLTPDVDVIIERERGPDRTGDVVAARELAERYGASV